MMHMNMHYSHKIVIINLVKISWKIYVKFRFGVLTKLEGSLKSLVKTAQNPGNPPQMQDIYNFEGEKLTIGLSSD